MTIQTGTHLGPYEVISPIGAGGMGEVWRARDTRLDREVAIKVLPAIFAEDAQLRVRFDREAKAISSLNHPHICTLHDVGHENGTHFLVMELIDGESLAERLQRGPLPIEQVLRYGAQIATALDAAHRRGVIHRDLKPGNVMITKSGAKLLDFGLAKASDPMLSTQQSILATEHKPVTERGMILGTFQYMSPEQLEGVEVDARSDIFALGTLLYEMATGRRAFQGASKTSLIAAIVSSQPAPISTIAPLTPPAFEHVVGKCLEKDPDERWQSAHDVASELRWIGQSGSQAGVAAPAMSSRRAGRRTLSLLAIAGWLAAAGLGFWAFREQSRIAPLRRVFRSELTLGGLTSVGNRGALTVSPEGRRVAFVVRQSGLATHDFQTGRVTVLEGTAGAIYPFWSPDSRWIGFFADGRLKKIESTGGPVQVICEARDGRGGTWSRNGTIVFAPDIAGPLLKVSAGGGTPAPATTLPDRNRWSHRNPHFLPDGEHFLFSSRLSTHEPVGSIAVASLRNGESRILGPGSNAQYADGHIFFVRDGNLVAQPFDADKRILSGSPIPLAQQVEYYNPRDLGNFSVAGAELLVFRQNVPVLAQLTWYDRSGRVVSTVGEPEYYIGGRSNGNVATLIRRDEGGSESVWVMDLKRGTATRATPNGWTALTRAVPSPDGKEIAISTATASAAANGLWIQAPSATAPQRKILDSSSFMVHDWSSDGKLLLGVTQEPQQGFDIGWISLDDPRTIRTFAASPANENFVRLSPNGRWIAFISDESGSNEIYISDFPEGKNRWQVTRSGGQGMMWANDGRELITGVAGRFTVYSVTESGAGIEIGTPTLLPPFEDAGNFLGNEGDRFLALRRLEALRDEPVRVVRNWRELVR